jgi:hypothetical protein
MNEFLDLAIPIGEAIDKSAEIGYNANCFVEFRGVSDFVAL